MTTQPQYIEKESFRLLVESVKDYAIFIIDTNGYVMSWNRGAEQIKGYTASEIIGEHFSIFYTTEQNFIGEAQLNLQKAKEMGRFETEGWRVRKDGSVFWGNVVFTALKNDKGELIGFGKVTRDMTKRRTAEDEIKRLNRELEKQLQNSRAEMLDYKHAIEESSIVAVTDQKGIINYVNDNFCKISQYSREELIGEDHRIINSGYHSQEFIRDLWVTIANGRIWRGELKNRAKDGSVYWVDTTIVPFLNEKGKPYQYVAIRADITPRKLAEEHIIRINEELENTVRERTSELTEALQQAKDLSDTKSRFVSMASHEFRTPLTAILSSIGLIEQYKAAEQQDKRQKHIQRIKSAVGDLTDILNDFLSVEKLEQGKTEVAGIRFNLYEFVEKVIEEIDAMVNKKKQKVIYTYTGPKEVFQDKKILQNVLLNLLSNAVKYSPEEKEILVTVVVQDELFTIAVKDNGIGIPLEAQKDLFSKFFRANNTANIQGTGLGLNIVRGYVELLTGSISFTSIENEGSTFTIEVPRDISVKAQENTITITCI